MVFTVKFDTDNSAFDDPRYEVARILRDTARQVEDGKTEGVVRDLNGNTVGTFKFTGRHRK